MKVQARKAPVPPFLEKSCAAMTFLTISRITKMLPRLRL